MNNCNQLYQQWLSQVKNDNDLLNELLSIKNNDEQINDRFYRNLEFGTGGLRGVIGAGTNRMNIYTVARATQGIAYYINKTFENNKRVVAISYDSRKNSKLFAETVARVLACNDIKVYIYNTLMPTPCLSFAVRNLKCSTGIMITASHNPAKYNGYKVYSSDGCQITLSEAEEILNCINNVDIFTVKKYDFKRGLAESKINYITENVFKEYIQSVKQELNLISAKNVYSNISIVYSPLNGTGLKPVLRALSECGYNTVQVVKEQEFPDENFTTCKYPNPEEQSAMKLGISYAKTVNADIILATDPDCDRIGIAVKDNENEYKLLSGNETGILMFDYICFQRINNKTMPELPIAVKTIVTTDLAKKIATNYNVKIIDVLTGFKFIGEQIGLLEKSNKEKSFVFGFEESYGYLSGSYVRDKDAVNASVIIANMTSFYKSKGVNLLERLQQIYDFYGYTYQTLNSYVLEGESGLRKISSIMYKLRNNINEIKGFNIIKTEDFLLGINNLPKSDVIKYTLEDGSTIVIRPSGTEPKIKIYVSVFGINNDQLKYKNENIIKIVKQFIF